MVTLSFIPNKENKFFNKYNYDSLIEKNAKFKGFCKYFVVTDTKDKRCMKYGNFCASNENCKIRRNTLENVL